MPLVTTTIEDLMISGAWDRWIDRPEWWVNSRIGSKRAFRAGWLAGRNYGIALERGSRWTFKKDGGWTAITETKPSGVRLTFWRRPQEGEEE